MDHRGCQDQLYEGPVAWARNQCPRRCHDPGFTYEAKTTSRLLGDIDLVYELSKRAQLRCSQPPNRTSSPYWQGNTYMDPTGASTFIDMSRLNVGESNADVVSPRGEGDFGEFMVVLVYCWIRYQTGGGLSPPIKGPNGDVIMQGFQTLRGYTKSRSAQKLGK